MRLQFNPGRKLVPISQCNICRCGCHMAGCMYCMELVCDCCKLHNVEYNHDGYIDVEAYATIVAERAVEAYRGRQPVYYGDKFMHKRRKYRV